MHVSWHQSTDGVMDCITSDGEVLGSIKPELDECGLRWRAVALIRGKRRTVGRRTNKGESMKLVEEKVGK